jgi:ABC-type enterobactin transport system permease subunit
MKFARFLMFLSLGVWIGGLIFLPIVAQISFTELPSPHLAGLVVRGAQIALHRIGLVGGAVFLICSLLEGRIAKGSYALFRPSQSHHRGRDAGAHGDFAIQNHPKDGRAAD